MSNQEPATILLIDDHPMLRTGVKQLISTMLHWRKTAYQYGTRYHCGWRSE